MPGVWVDLNDVTGTGETTTFVDYATPDVALAPGSDPARRRGHPGDL